MNESYRAKYADLYHHHWWWRAREEFLERLLDRLVGPGGAGDVLDFGSGDALFFPILSKYGEPWGHEPDATLLDPRGMWRGRIRSELCPSDAAETARYGLVLALDVLEHIEDPLPVVQELKRRMRPGGWFVATVPAFQSMWTGHDVVNHHMKRYRLRELEALISEAGFEIEDSRYMFFSLAFVKWVLAFKERLTHDNVAPPHVPPAKLNRVLLATCRIEQRLLGAWRPPFGSSALVVGRAG